MSPVYVVGAGPQGRIVSEILAANGRTAVLLDDKRELWGITVVGGLDALPRGAEAIAAIGKPSLRLRLLASIVERGGVQVSAIHPSAVVMPSVKVGPGSVIHPGSVVNTGTALGLGAVINTSAVVEHDCVLEDGVNVSPGARIGGRVRIGSGAFIATGAIVFARVEIGAGAIVGAGSIVTKDVPAGTLVFGSPARERGRVDDTFDWGRVL